ncbi:ribose-5-phosphate isomerase RpiA [Candidatus Liberibacter sp.]|uniref:ribose-5-phosphate isomerase RpiA n=1 Tax=Candidatus Liberibacter sp. TaxID=34022 RepID=UPI0015F485A9|nr:ribose-5-phosphate isomerase RpiA [Candidatus Liberibacter sp.]MBA5724377.1 ribose-5-phosphate isomerase RpiA [Candidatus Liberibacter sp.]
MEADQMKKNAARLALQYVDHDMVLGIGTGSTSKEFILLLSQRIADGLRVQGIATSRDTENFCKENRVPLRSIEDVSCIDLTVDGCDETDSRLRLIKGRGGALFYEKIVASISSRMVVIADETKVVEFLGQGSLPIEVSSFGVVSTCFAIKKVASQLGLKEDLCLRRDASDLFISDGGNYIVDAFFGCIPDPEFLSNALHAIPGVIEHGLFLEMAECVVVGKTDGTCEVLNR